MIILIMFSHVFFSTCPRLPLCACIIRPFLSFLLSVFPLHAHVSEVAVIWDSDVNLNERFCFFFVYYSLFLSPAFKSFNLQIMTGISHVGLRELSGYNVIALFFNKLNILKSDCNTSRINFNVWQAVREISLIIASSHSQRAAWAHV